MRPRESFGLCTRCDQPTDLCECPPYQSGCEPRSIGPAFTLGIGVVLGAIIAFWCCSKCSVPAAGVLPLPPSTPAAKFDQIPSVKSKARR